MRRGAERVRANSAARKGREARLRDNVGPFILQPVQQRDGGVGVSTVGKGSLLHFFDEDDDTYMTS